MDGMSREMALVRKAVMEAKEQAYFYPRGEGELKFNDNTSPFGPSPSVRKVMERSVVDIIGGFGESSFYPDQNADDLRAAISSVENVEPDSVVVGTGADELLDMIFRVFVNDGDIVTIPVPAYFMYEHFASLNSATIHRPYLGRPPSLPRKSDDRSRVYILSNPHNPTGTLFPEEDIVDILNTHGGIVVVDEAYAEYSASTLVPLISSFPNLVVVRTFSKIHGLPNFRVGYSISSTEVAAQLRKVKNPFNVPTVSQKLATAAVSDRRFVETVREKVASERSRVSLALKSLGFHVFESRANFLLADAGDSCDGLFSALTQRGVYMKRVTDSGYENCLRLTVRSTEENTEMLRRLSEAVSHMH